MVVTKAHEDVLLSSTFLGKISLYGIELTHSHNLAVE